MLRLILVFVHVAGAAGMFAALGIESAALLQLRRGAGPVDTDAALRVARWIPRVGMPSVLLTVLSGLYLTITVWGWQASWIGIGFSSLIAVAIIGATTGPKPSRMQRTAIGGGRVLWASFVTRAFILLGIVFLMIVKPPPQMALAAMGTAVAAGLLTSLPILLRRDSAVSLVPR